MSDRHWNGADAHADPIEATNGTRGLVSEAARRGAADASEAAARTWMAAGRFTRRFIYTTTYTVSYGVVFPCVFLAKSVPVNNAAVRGLIDGAHAARGRVDAMLPSGEDREGRLRPMAALSPA